MKISSITAPNPGPFTLDGTRTWLLGETAVIDPGPAIQSHVEAILAAMPGLEVILITHRHGDHAPAAVPVAQRSGARIFAPPGVLDDSSVDRRLHGGEWIEIGDERLQVVHTPGHTGEHVCFVTQDGDLFTGDTILGSGTTAIFPPDGDMSDYMASLRKLRALGPKRIFPAHGPERDDAIALIDEYLRHREDRERQILAALDRPLGLSELREAIYRGLHPGLAKGAEAQLSAHLTKLEREGRIAREGERWVAAKTLPSGWM